MKKTVFFCIVMIVFFASCEDILEIPDISQQQIELIAPAQGSTVTDSIVKFSWNGINDATAYHIQVATPSFGNASQLVLDSIMTIDSTFVGTRISKKLPNSDYEWRVKAKNSGYETNFSQSAFKVTASSN